MTIMNRRSFIQKTSIGAGAALLLSAIPKAVFAGAKAANMPLGFQTFPIRDELAKDFAGTLRMMAVQGYQLTELCSPKGYAQIGFGHLVDKKPADIRNIINDAGLSCPSCHFGFGEFNDENINDRIEFAQGLGLTQMICSTF